MKPRITGIVTAFCLALLCGAMAWTTHSMLRMESEQNRMSADAAVQEMARLALWRMESIASGLVIEESARPPEHYRTLARADGVLENKSAGAVRQEDLVSVSPLLREPPPQVKLYFEMDAAGALRSPQVPVGRELMVCQAVHSAEALPKMISDNTGQLEALRGLLDRDLTEGRLRELRDSLSAPASLRGNRLLIWGSSAAPSQAWTEPRGSVADPAARQVFNASPVQQSAAWLRDAAQQMQLDLNSTEAQARAGIVEAGKARRSSYNNSIADQSLLPPPAAAPPAPAASRTATAPPVNNTVAAEPGFTEITDLRPFWIGDALLLTRKVASGGREWIQGAWLNWDLLRSEMLAAILDRFPGAQIVPALENAPRGAHLLASLPVQLLPGAVTFTALPFWSPLRISLAIAWLCVLLAVAAVALVLRGMMVLSERRASFVSSVTHELRTPLATFKLYSEMLADGMVKEEAKRQQYLETLTGEADRLGHLVENVLAYSRIERGRGPASLSAVTAGDLLARIEPRLNQRALLAGMDFSMTAGPDVPGLLLKTDAGAVEQILCNLVDNACKYGRRDGAPGTVELVASRERRRFSLIVRDHGPGIERSEERRLFLPFHKSAREAAHSQPGVGLGLALCRRLAAELGGTLEIDRTWRHGAAFVLRLPA